MTIGDSDAPDAKNALEEGSVFAPRFDADGLITCVAVDDTSGDVLMVAHMNAEALHATLESGFVTYWSRSRQTLWRKGETSGQLQSLAEMRTDCDQDALLVRVRVGGDGGCCHTGRRSCFYRSVAHDGDGTRLVKDGLTGSRETSAVPHAADGQGSLASR